MNHETTDLTPNTLARLVVDALERTAFVLADPCDDPEQLPPADTFARIEFRGPTDGCVELLASRSFARNLAASILGADASDVSDLQSEEALGGSDCRFSLGLPQLGRAEAAGDDTACILDAEGARLEVHCHRARAA